MELQLQRCNDHKDRGDNSSKTSVPSFSPPIYIETVQCFSPPLPTLKNFNITHRRIPKEHLKYLSYSQVSSTNMSWLSVNEKGIPGRIPYIEVLPFRLIVAKHNSIVFSNWLDLIPQNEKASYYKDISPLLSTRWTVWGILSAEQS